MIITIDLTSLADNFTGIERFASSIAYYMVKNNPNDTFILLFKQYIFESFLEFQKRNNVQFIVLKGKNKLWFSQVTLTRFLYRLKADRWLFMAFPTPLLFFKKGTISTIHDIGCWDYPDAMTLKSKIFFRILYHKSALWDSKIVTVSEFSKKRIMQRLNVKEKNLYVIYNGLSPNFHKYKSNPIEIAEIKKKYNLPEKYILCLSTLEPRKNIRLLVEACCVLWKKRQLSVELVLAGRKGWKVDHLLDNLDQEQHNKIHFTGFIDEKDLPTIYNQAQVFIFPSIYEGFGIPPLEALAAGTDVISSDSSSMPEVLGNAVIYFKNNDLDDLEDKIVHYFDGKHSTHGNLPRKYDWEMSANNFRQILDL